MRRKASLLLILAAAVACGIAACDGDEKAIPAPPSTDGGGTTDAPVTPGTDGSPGTDSGGGDTGTDAPPGDQLFTDYVKSLIDTQTSDTNNPDDWTTKTFAPDPEDPNAFNSYFP